MPAKLFSKTGKFKNLEFTIGTEKATIGKDRSNDIVLREGSISRKHALIEYDEAERRYYLEDLGSLNGTQLDGAPVTGREPLAHLNVITFHRHRFIFQDLEMCAHRHGGAGAGKARSSPSVPAGDAAPPVPATQEPASSMATAQESELPVLPASLGGMSAAGEPEATRIEPAPPVLPSSLGRARPDSPEGEEGEEEDAPALALELIDSPGGKTKRFPLSQGENVVGRFGEAGIQLASPTVSRRHAVITVDGTRCRVRDEGSSNHTYLGDEEVREEVEVPAGAELCFGDVKARIIRAD